ncbi:MAG: L-seryl-tRNA(Sec) selenium transferase [Deltaproteobacteria bacterium]|nr:L-seryl-tRNA(Sec) selenium transferase [Deltaproteobacteria bacterium]
MEKEHTANFRGLPSVDALLKNEELRPLIETSGRELATFGVRQSINRAREMMKSGRQCPDFGKLISWVREVVEGVSTPSLKPVINATGVVIHTNLGRAPLGTKVRDDISDIITGYSNLEFDLDRAERGDRNAHLTSLLTFITGAEASLVVNNNAAALILALNTLAKGKEVVISRGELIEIGGSFRIPEILAASGAIMVEVGTTNKTRLSDYQKAVGPETAVILKAHKSNYTISGFTEEVGVGELARLAASHRLVTLYDIGSGLLRKPARLSLANEPDVRSALGDGADLVTFSGDKLLGGPQSGIIVGKAELVSRLAQAPMMRALRVGKLTISALACVVRSYLTDESLLAELPFFRMLGVSDERLKQRAKRLLAMLGASGIAALVVKSRAQCGGGTLPGLEIDSYAVALSADYPSQRARSAFAERVYRGLLKLPRPVVAILRQGEILFDLLTVEDEQLEPLASAIIAVAQGKVDR